MSYSETYPSVALIKQLSCKQMVFFSERFWNSIWTWCASILDGSMSVSDISARITFGSNVDRIYSQCHSEKLGLDKHSLSSKYKKNTNFCICTNQRDNTHILIYWKLLIDKVMWLLLWWWSMVLCRQPKCINIPSQTHICNHLLLDLAD